MFPKGRNLRRMGFVSQYWCGSNSVVFSDFSVSCRFFFLRGMRHMFHRQSKHDLTLKISCHNLSPFVNARNVTASLLGIVALVADPQWCYILCLVTSSSQNLPVSATRSEFLFP